MTQERKVLEYIMKFGSITSYQSFLDLGITRLSDRIFTLKKKGYEFTDEYVTQTNRYNEDIKYKRYYLKGVESNECSINS